MNIYIYDVGDFRHKIEIQELTTSKLYNRPIREYKTISRTKAKTFKDNKTSTSEGQQTEVDKVVKRILIRTPKKFELTNDHRIIFKGKPYKIKESNDIKELGVYTELVIERVE